jgi:hypothetical protein
VPVTAARKRRVRGVTMVERLAGHFMADLREHNNDRVDAREQMRELPGWTYSGAIDLTNDLSVHEGHLHAGRVAAAERGYDGEPDSIDVSPVMLAGDGDRFVSAEDASGARLNFVPTHIRVS